MFLKIVGNVLEALIKYRLCVRGDFVREGLCPRCKIHRGFMSMLQNSWGLCPPIQNEQRGGGGGGGVFRAGGGGIVLQSIDVLTNSGTF